MVKKIAVIVAGLLAVLVIVVSLMPSRFKIVRSAEIEAPPAVVFAILNDLHQGVLWSPFDREDMKMTRKFEGPATGTGSLMHFDGDSEVGTGTLAITESKPNEFIGLQLDMTKPMAASNTIRYELAPSSLGTKVTWSMEGNNNAVGKVFCLIMDMEGMMAKEFDKGLANLNTAAKADSQQAKASASAPATSSIEENKQPSVDQKLPSTPGEKPEQKPEVENE